MGIMIYANQAAFVFLLAGTESHGQGVSIWQMIPMTTPLMSRRFGVEIEFLSTVSADQVMNSLRAAGLPVEYEGYTHRVTPHWKVVSDGSCGYELVSPVLEGEAGLEEVRIAATALEAAGAQVDRKCGFHVHFDARSMPLKAVKNLFKLWLKFEDVLDTFQPPSRRGSANIYCQTNLPYEPLGAGDHRGLCSRMFRKIDDCRSIEEMKALYPCRYRKLNIHSYFRHQTLEVRHHSGTTNPEKITNWVRLMARLFDAAESAAAVRNRPEDNGVGMPRMKWFFQAINAKGLTKFYTARAKKLAA
jgi:hypothetical protein